jgi:hypothetical protein
MLEQPTETSELDEGFEKDLGCALISTSCIRKKRDAGCRFIGIIYSFDITANGIPGSNCKAVAVEYQTKKIVVRV